MDNDTQLQRYKKLLVYIENNFKTDINIDKVEEVCHYSYRNINRIFEALHNETIGKYIKRLRLEKAAQYLKYTDMPVSDIAYEVGFEDRAAFSKAFKNKYDSSPSTYRNNSESFLETIQQAFLPTKNTEREKLQFEIEYLPDFDYIFLEYRGSYEDISSIDRVWKQLEDYAMEKALLSDQSIFMTEIIDDIEISDNINSRYNSAFILERPLNFIPSGLFRTKKHKRQKYAKFNHRGSYQSCAEYYEKIYAFWMLDVALEFEDKSILEFYPDYNENSSSNAMLTEIYIPVR